MDALPPEGRVVRRAGPIGATIGSRVGIVIYGTAKPDVARMYGCRLRNISIFDVDSNDERLPDGCLSSSVLWRERAAVAGGGMPLGQPVAVAEELVPERALDVLPLHEAPLLQDWRYVVDELLVRHRAPGS